MSPFARAMNPSTLMPTNTDAFMLDSLLLALGLGLDPLLAPVLIPQLQGAGGALRLQDHVGVPGGRGARQAESRRLLGRAELHRRTPALGDQPEEDRLGVGLARGGASRRDHAEAGAHAALVVDDLERPAA